MPTLPKPQDYEDGVRKDLLSALRSSNARIILLIPPAIIAVVFAGVLARIFANLSLAALLWTLGSVIFSVLLGLVIALTVARWMVIENFNETLGAKIEQLDKLVETCKQLKQLMKDNKSWLIDDTEVFELESAADEEILVIAPDLHYENQEEYLSVIVRNLVNVDGPSYKYLLPRDGYTDIQKGDLLKKLRQRLSSRGIADPEGLIAQRFAIHLIPEDAFPQAALYGLAIYQDRQQKVHCLQYMPREFGNLNVLIPAEGDVGRRLVARARSHFSRLVPGPVATH